MIAMMTISRQNTKKNETQVTFWHFISLYDQLNSTLIISLAKKTDHLHWPTGQIGQRAR